MKGKSLMHWVHFACDRHEVVTANGCLSESLLLGPMAIKGLEDGERRDVVRLFGSAATPGSAQNGPPARDCLSVGDVRRRIAILRKEAQRRREKDIQKWNDDLNAEQFETAEQQDVISKACA